MTLIQTREAFDVALQDIRESSLLALDTETPIAERWNRYLVGFSYYCLDESGNERTAYFPFRHNHDRQLFLNGENLPIEWLEELKDAILGNPERQYIFHNAKFDIPVFLKEDIDLTQVFYWDTMLMAHLVDENRFDYKLKHIAVDIFGPDANNEAQHLKKLLSLLKNKWEKCPPQVMAQYCCKDSKLTYGLYQHFLPQMKEQDLVQLWDQTLLYNKALISVEQHGVKINPLTAQNLHDQSQKEMAALRISLGFDPMKPSQLAHRLYAAPSEGGLGFRPSSYSKRKSTEFPQGLPNMDDLILSRLDHPEVEQVRRYRTLVKADSTWYEGFLNKMSPDRRLHAEYKQHGTKTGRLSCAEPNLQQLPRDKEKTPVKSILSSSSGHELWEFDYSQIELRFAALYAEQENILEAYRTGADFHQMTAELVGAYDVPGVSKESARYVGKESNFLLIYTGGPDVLRLTLWKKGRLDVPFSTCQVIHDNFHRAYPGFRNVSNRAVSVAYNQGYVKLWNGRRRHFKFPSESHKAFNSIIQGGCAAVVQGSFIQLFEAGYNLCGQVHDSVWIEIPTDEVEVTVPKVQSIMSDWVTEKFQLPFPVDAKRLDLPIVA